VAAVDGVGMRELRQNPAPVLRTVKAGAEVTVSANGRPVARIVPIESPAGVDGKRAAHIYIAEVDDQWQADRAQARQDVRLVDPWVARARCSTPACWLPWMPTCRAWSVRSVR
jgi:prevent-host-death family protein